MVVTYGDFTFGCVKGSHRHVVFVVSKCVEEVMQVVGESLFGESPVFCADYAHMEWVWVALSVLRDGGGWPDGVDFESPGCLSIAVAKYDIDCNLSISRFEGGTVAID